MTRVIGLALLYVFASPIYAIQGVRKLLKLWRIAQTMRRGVITCIDLHENVIDVLGTCKRCGATEYGNRLRCRVCDDRVAGFACDKCKVWIQVF